MNTSDPSSESGNESYHSLEVLSEITGVSKQTILLYHEHGLIHTSGGDLQFDDDAVRVLRRIEHLREVCEPNFAGLKLLMQLADEVESLRAELRARR